MNEKEKLERQKTRKIEQERRDRGGRKKKVVRGHGNQSSWAQKTHEEVS